MVCETTNKGFAQKNSCFFLSACLFVFSFSLFSNTLNGFVKLATVQCHVYTSKENTIANSHGVREMTANERSSYKRKTGSGPYTYETKAVSACTTPKHNLAKKSVPQCKHQLLEYSESCTQPYTHTQTHTHTHTHTLYYSSSLFQQ